jgi:hypothetical protein
MKPPEGKRDDDDSTATSSALLVLPTACFAMLAFSLDNARQDVSAVQ